MAYQASSYYTALAAQRAESMGIDLNPTIGKALLKRINSGDFIWKSHGDRSDTEAYYLNHANRRIRLIVNVEKDKIITIARTNFAMNQAVSKAERLGITLNLAMATLIMDKIKSGDVMSQEDSYANTRAAKLTVDGKNIRVVYSEETGVIAQVDDYTGPPVVSPHPAVSRHAAERMMQRYDIELTAEMSAEIVSRIAQERDLIDHYSIDSGAMVAITEVAPDTPARIIYHFDGDRGISIVTVLKYSERDGRQAAKEREDRYNRLRAERHDRYRQSRKNQKRQTAIFHRTQKRHEDDDDYAYLEKSY